MSTHDIHDREYAKLSSLKPGDVVSLDDGYTCGRPRQVVLAADENGELYFPCRAGRHQLDGQLSEVDNDHLVGVYST